MKKPSVKDLFAVGGVVLFVSAGIWIVAQSNANDEAPIMIDTNKYTATQHIQEVHLNDTSSSKKIGLKNQDGLVLGVGSVGVDERVGKLKNDAGGASAVIAGSGNGNWGSESSLIVGGENNQLANGKIGSVVMGGKANQVDSSETVVLASKDSATHGTGAVVVAVDRGEVFGENSLSFAGDAIVRRNDSMVIGSAVMMNGEGSFVFNGREQQGIDVNTDNSFIVGANNGLIIGTNKNNGSGIGLTVNGAVKVGEARGNDNMQTGAIFRVACSSPAGASCLCANISGQVKSISSNPACDNVCAGKSKQCFLDAKCGTRAITYAAAETTRRANTDFCTVGSHVQGADPRFPNVGEVSWTCVSDFGGASANCSAKKKLLPKEDAKCGSYHGMNFMAASLTNWPAGGTFCEKGAPTPTVPAFPKTGKPVSWTCGGENLNTVPCSANGCNRCSKEGFPYCFPVDFGPSCGSTPTQPVNGQCGTSKDSCASGDFVDATDTATDYKWQCNGKNGGTSVACSLKKPTQPVNGKCGTSKDSCASGDFVDATDTATDYKWQCNGKNGGSSVACSLKKPTQPVNGKCAGSVAVPVDGTKLVDYAKANPSLFCDPGTLVSPELSNGKLTWKCAGLNGGEPSQTCTASCPSGYSLQNGACVKSASQYEWKCIEVKKEGEYCSLPMENKDIRSGSGFQNENGHDGRYDSAHKGCSYSTREDCEKNRCQWYSGGDPRFLGEIPVCADKSAPNDRTKDSKNPDIDCKDTTPVCGSAKEADVTVKLKWENAGQSYLSCMVRIKVEGKSSSYTPIERHFTFRHNGGGEYIANLKEHYPNLKIKKGDVVKIQKVDCSGDKINNKWPQWESREDCKSTGQMRFYPCKIWHTINTSPYTIEVPLGDYRRS